jgi:hypothetical protein
VLFDTYIDHRSSPAAVDVDPLQTKDGQKTVFAKKQCTSSPSTTDLETAKLMAEIGRMTDGPRKRELVKKARADQRRRMGIEKASLFKVFYDLGFSKLLIYE